ncbi:HAMP domain-containing protein [Glycomyces buryatensis]|uniref:Circadian input-output histidine kinase CikA n=1 Tax=Glycomyces buryatensis TaxID=2570927 RepID=A0A4S8Q9N3_9ACTN|nr:HAMP domain-containing protein [Glycomyces buryatensis]THV40950.1 HAMP domain-containing protein [Glycomyces buryatensis]
MTDTASGAARPAADESDVLRSLADALGAVERGDFSVRLPRGEGLAGEVVDRFNAVVEQADRQTRDLALIARVVGQEGSWNHRLDIEHLDGGWSDGAASVNRLVEELVRPTTELGRVLEAVAAGDLTQEAALEIEGKQLRGEFRRLGETVNQMVGLLRSFAGEVTRVSKEVGTDGILGGQADVQGVSGTWRSLTDAVNTMASNLTDQVRSISTVTQAIAEGDLNQKITVKASGEVAELADTINSLTETLQIFAGEVTRVAREVGTEGRLGGQAQVPGVSGTWKNLTDNVNSMASSLTDQVRDIAKVTSAVARGDLNQKIAVPAQGEILELKTIVNTMVDQLSNFADEVTRVAKEVGTDGRLGGQAQVFGVSGTWRDLTQNVNQLAGNLTEQVRNIAKVTSAVAAGDLNQKITVKASGEIAEVKNTVNTMVDQLSSFADEVTRVAREVGSQGRLGGQANVQGVSGTWKDLTDNVNLMASNLTAQVRNISSVATAVAAGDLGRQITVDAQGEMLELKSTMNSMVNQLSQFADEVTRVAREVGTDGKLGGQANVQGVSGIWEALTDNVNGMASNLTAQVRNISSVATAVARGDLSRQITVDAQGEMLELKSTMNSMVEQLSQFSYEVTRVAREVGTEGILGGQASVPGVSGTWKDLTDNVNSMATNLTLQVRNIAEVTTAVARGDLTGQITVDAQGEFLEMKNTVNTMVNQLSSFAGEVTRVAREVGVEGNLGGQAEVAGVEGTWLALTRNVNSLAATLTLQLRAIANVAHAVARGDLTQSVDFEAAGEIADLTESINQMITALRDKTRQNTDVDWLNSNLARISSLLQGRRGVEEVTRMVLDEVTTLIDAQTSTFYVRHEDITGNVSYRLNAVYGHPSPGEKVVIADNEGMVGQAAASKRTIHLHDIPEGYLEISSGLGQATPTDLIILPVQFGDKVRGVIEFASFNTYSGLHKKFLDSLAPNVGVTLATIEGNARTEVLLRESQRMAGELRAQSERLQETNIELEDKAALLSAQNKAIEVKNLEVESARQDIEEKAEQLAQASKYKSEFLANVSHELRTPLNSLLLLARLLSENADNNLSDRQIEFARTIHNAGTDLLTLIDDILDLSKIEAGRMDVAVHSVDLGEVLGDIESTFRPQADDKQLDFKIDVGPGVPATLKTDGQKFQQVLRNLLSNAVKFTRSGSVTLAARRVPADLRFDSPHLNSAAERVAFSVIDTGIGVPENKKTIIFEPFQQADGTTRRNFGGTGLGLSISKSLSQMLGGDVFIEHTGSGGSKFSFVIPAEIDTDGDFQSIRAELPLPVEEPGPTILTGAPETPSSSAAAADLDGATVLIVDDDIRNVFALTAALELHGIDVHYAENGADGIDALQHHTDIDIVLMDSMMPGMDGNETTRVIRRMSQFEDLPIIFLTAQALAEQREKSVEAGASAYLTKPVDLDLLLDTMAQWIGPDSPARASGGDNGGPTQGEHA